MNRILAVVLAEPSDVRGVLAGEALRSAAKARSTPIEIEVRVGGAALNPLDWSGVGPGDRLLLVAANDQSAPDLPRRPERQADLARVLENADAVLDDLGSAAAADATPVKRIVAVTSCPTGIAHTFMAAEGLTQAAAALGLPIRIETQGSVGAQTPLTAEEIAEADLVVIAADREVDRARFAGKRVFVSGAKPAINDGQGLIRRAFEQAQVQPAAAATGAKTASAKTAGPYKHLMTGVSFMLPFVVAGGLLIALAFALGGVNADKATGTLAYTLFEIGAKGAFALIVPALAGYIAFSIADRPGIAPGMVGGMLAASLGAGFLGGIAAGFIAGYTALGLNRAIRLPRTLEGLKPILILPLAATLITGLLMIYAVGGPVAKLLALLTETLRGMQGSSAVLLGLLLGGMMAFDMGGPVNKAAYAFGVGLIASQVYTPMAAVMVGGMTPPLALALATRLSPRRFTLEEREAGPAAAVLGLAFISEGAIPFAARDPLLVIPCLMAGSALAGAISMAVNVELKTPHGGVFVLPIPGAVTHPLAYVGALAAGAFASALLLILVKKPVTATTP